MEIERKFIINKSDVMAFKSSVKLPLNIEQHYLHVSDDKEIRVRRVSTTDGSCEHLMTIKTTGTLSREEVEFSIPKEEYMKIIDSKMYIGKPIKKTRYKRALDTGHVVEVDMYSGHLVGLYVAEVEFDSIEDSENFVAPAWFGQEVTSDCRYKNKNLACIKPTVV